MGDRAVVIYDVGFANIFARHKDAHPIGPDHDAVTEGNDAIPIAEALGQKGYDADIVALDDGALDQLAAIGKDPPRVVFNLCDSIFGRPDLAHVVPAMLDGYGVCYTGADAAGLSLTKRKHDVKAVLVREGLPTPRYQVIGRRDALARFSLELVPPVILKLTAEHASVGLEAASVCWDIGEIVARAQLLRRDFDQAILVEEYVDGREFFVSSLGDPPRPLPFMEQTFDHIPDGFLKMRTFDTKWFDQPGIAGDEAKLQKDPRWSHPIARRTPAAPWEGHLSKIEKVGARALEVCGGRDWGRVDMRLDAGGVPMIIDVTPNSYLHPKTPCAMAAAHVKMSYADLIEHIVDSARARHDASGPAEKAKRAK